MKRIITALAALMLISPFAYGEEAQAEPAQEQASDGWVDEAKNRLKLETIEFRVDYRSQYIFANGEVIHPDHVVQSELYLEWTNGVYFDVWTSLPVSLGETGDDYATEADLAIGWTGSFSDYNVDLGFAHYNQYHVDRIIEGTDFLSPYGEISRDFSPAESVVLSPYFRTEFYFTPDGDVVGDVLLYAGLTAEWAATERLTAWVKPSLVYDSGPLYLDAAFIADVEGGLRWALNDKWSLELPYLHWVNPLTAVDDERTSTLVYGLSVVYAN